MRVAMRELMQSQGFSGAIGVLGYSNLELITLGTEGLLQLVGRDSSLGVNWAMKEWKLRPRRMKTSHGDRKQRVGVRAELGLLESFPYSSV